jgi:hypothetical protein
MVIMRIFFVLVLAGFIFTSCSEPQPATGKGPYDSLFLGFYFGMEKKEFYDYCWAMNKQKKFIHGPTNQSVEYYLKDELDHPVFMRFYPYFYKDKVYQMPVTFTYEAWAPWNRDFHADKLIEEVIPMLSRWYGGKFESTIMPKKGKVYARIDGNRRISAFVRDEQFVQVIFTDIPSENLVKKESLERAEN